jgi:hypothetical protein
VGIGLPVPLLASAINFGVARLLLREGCEHNPITLEANAHHLMTDIWSSAGVIVGVGAVALTGWQRLDPIIALIVSANIIWTGVPLRRQPVEDRRVCWRASGKVAPSHLTSGGRVGQSRVMELCDQSTHIAYV